MNQRLEKFKKLKRIQTKDLAGAANLPNNSVSQFLTGTIQFPRVSFFVKIANAFPDLNLNWLILGEGPMLLINRNSDTKGEDYIPKSLEEKELIQHIETLMERSQELFDQEKAAIKSELDKLEGMKTALKDWENRLEKWESELKGKG